MKLYVSEDEFWPYPYVRDGFDGFTEWIVELPEDEAEEWKSRLAEAERTVRAFVALCREQDPECPEKIQRHRDARDAMKRARAAAKASA